MIVTLAWRNLWRHARRSLITASAMAVGVGLCMAILAINEGSFAMMFDVLVDQQTGHVQVHHPQYPTRHGLYDTIPNADATVDAIHALPGNRAATGRLYGFGLIGAADESVGGRIVGVDPAHERGASPVPDRMRQGEWLADEPRQEILLGKGLAEELGVGVGGEVVVVTQAADGSMGNALFTVRGVYRTGQSMLDESGGIVHLRDAQDLLVLPDQVHEITVLAADADAIEAHRDAVRGAVPADLLVRTWQEASPQAAQIFAAQGAASWIILAIVFSVAGFGIVNTMLMSVFERTRELGVMTALGIRPARIVGMVVVESLLLATLASVLGLALGAVLDAWLVVYGIDFSSTMPDGFDAMGMVIDPVMKGKVLPGPIVQTVASVFVVSALASLWPAARAARLRPIDALRQD